MEKNQNNEKFFGFDIETIARSWCYKKRFNTGLPRPLNGKDVQFFLYGRNALYAILSVLKNEKKLNNILFPAYSCGDEIEPAKKLGYNIYFYKLKSEKNFQIDLDDIIKNIEGFNGVLIVTHYLGFVQRDIKVIANYCKKNGIVLIENCAHCFGTKYNGRAIGTFGDYSIFSIRKNLPLPHGGALIINNNSIIKDINRVFKNSFYPPSSEAINLDLFIFLGYKLGLFKHGTKITDPLRKLSQPQSLHGPRLTAYGGYNLELSYLAKAMILHINSKELAALKRKNYLRYLNYFKKNRKDNFLIAEKLLNGEYPMFFPLYVKDSKALYKKIKEYNITGVQPFWNYMHHFLNWRFFRNENILKKGILVLPTYYFIGYKNLKIILKNVI
ncbi:MAG: DegT/DnrJ/EryC1/StrS aminotransferase family protein [Parcubacteria group bacterium Licking1014_1]|nr:MAG: DegT/DnrJ/EryC1/StrS aminotransferase family protein [Parcubacteria group bacterium Licking1014_1]